MLYDQIIGAVLLAGHTRNAVFHGLLTFFVEFGIHLYFENGHEANKCRVIHLKLNRSLISIGAGPEQP